MIILMCHWKNASFSKQDHNSLIKGCRQWKEITLSHCITYLGFKYEKLSHEERRINSAFDEKGRIKVSILSFVIDSLSGKASLFPRRLHACKAHCSLQLCLVIGKRSSNYCRCCWSKRERKKTVGTKEVFWVEHLLVFSLWGKTAQITVLSQIWKIKMWLLHTFILSFKMI